MNTEDNIIMKNELELGKGYPKTYKFKVKNEMFESANRQITGLDVCTIAGLTPPERYNLSVKVKGRYSSVKLDEVIDLAQPGVEKFDYTERDCIDG